MKVRRDAPSFISPSPHQRHPQQPAMPSHRRMKKNDKPYQQDTVVGSVSIQRPLYFFFLANGMRPPSYSSVWNVLMFAG